MRTRSRLTALLVAGILCLAGVLLIGYLPSRVDGGVELTVYRLLTWLRDRGAPEWVNYDFADFVANVALFVPIGVIAALLLPWRAWWAAIPIGAALSGALELGQLLFLPERYASVTDVLANSIGALIGALIGAAVSAIRMRRAPAASPPRAPRAARR